MDHPFAAPWWGVVTLITVAYGDVTPVATEGRLAATALMLLGIGLFGAITATITSYLMTHEMHAVDSDEPSATERPTAVKRTSSASSSLVSELERLAELHFRRDLTADEFTAAKSRLLVHSASEDST